MQILHIHTLFLLSIYLFEIKNFENRKTRNSIQTVRVKLKNERRNTMRQFTVDMLKDWTSRVSWLGEEGLRVKK